MAAKEGSFADLDRSRTFSNPSQCFSVKDIEGANITWGMKIDSMTWHKEREIAIGRQVKYE
jgi:hypothetical protein